MAETAEGEVAPRIGEREEARRGDSSLGVDSITTITTGTTTTTSTSPDTGRSEFPGPCKIPLKQYAA